MLLVGIIVAIARYVSETAVIRMVDEYENTGTKMTVREGFRDWMVARRLAVVPDQPDCASAAHIHVLIFFIAGLIMLVSNSETATQPSTW